ncbi:hypothetical protein RWE15_08855 [Virgibacillus halophilus]|uniref:Uncharacterized protein n=1 Tax=Tigheibacillus halophilus TaxID=361280 RepID=A0ABU5C5C0_9BACI|nr:hypothetical protein [Virgibacillus halophilus]
MSRLIPRAAISGTATGVLFMAFFRYCLGWYWHRGGYKVGEILGYQPSLCVLAWFYVQGGIHLLRASRNAPAVTSKSDMQYRKRIGLGFGITFTAEAVLIAAAGAILGAANHFEYFFPVMALIVGIHFFPLAHLFQVSGYYITGTLLCMLSLITFLLVPHFYWCQRTSPSLLMK